MQYKLKGKVAIVVGGSGQIGKETIDILIKSGCQVINLDYVRLRFKNKNYYFKKIDITNEREIINFKKDFQKKFKKLNILVNHAHYRGNPKKLDPNNNFFKSLDDYQQMNGKKPLMLI